MDYSVMSNENKVTSIEELLKYAGGEIIELPPFTKDTTFFAKLKRPSLLAMVRSGKIPNELLESANSLFVDGLGKTATERKLDDDMMNQLLDIMEVVCEDSFVEPTYKQIKDAGIQLTDEQIMFVFTYAQSGQRALESFRDQR